MLAALQQSGSAAARARGATICIAPSRRARSGISARTPTRPTSRERLAPLGIMHLPLFISPNDTARPSGVPGSRRTPARSTAAQLATAPAAPPRDGGFSYVVAPDGVLFELTGGPATRDSFSHIHFFHEQPLCAANWYVEHLGMELPPMRDSSGKESPRAPWNPCDVKYGEAGWPALEPIGTIRQPSGHCAFRERHDVVVSATVRRRRDAAASRSSCRRADRCSTTSRSASTISMRCTRHCAATV